MPKRLTTNEFIKKAREIHGDRYDYSLVKYFNNRTNVTIICKIHGAFEQIPNTHLLNHGCPKCANNIRYTTKEFIEKAKKAHGDRYDYSLVDYRGKSKKVKIICKIHGIFLQSPDQHVGQKQNCPFCAGVKVTNDSFIENAKKIHGDVYDYSKVIYKTCNKNVKIICHKHGTFLQTPHDHLSGCGCKKCGIEKRANSNTIGTDIFIKRAKDIHGNRYDYSLVDYKKSDKKVKIICKEHGIFLQAPDCHISQKQGCPKCADTTLTIDEFIRRSFNKHGMRYDYSKVKFVNSYEKVEIICRIHGSFFQVPYSHWRTQGCPKCTASSGEKKITEILRKLHIKFIHQKRFKNCRNEIPLPFDFYFKHNDKKFLIEYDGRYHFEPIKLWGGNEYLKEVQHHDSIKNKFSQENGFILIRIPYTEFDNIETILTDAINKKD